jgi:NAD(P)-dependent dehydrogenase (short-subunit alcohol dehydrogenase family)
MPVPKRIVITGVSRGLGRALVEGFVARSHVVLGCAMKKRYRVLRLRSTIGGFRGSDSS